MALAKCEEVLTHDEMISELFTEIAQRIFDEMNFKRKALKPFTEAFVAAREKFGEIISEFAKSHEGDIAKKKRKRSAYVDDEAEEADANETSEESGDEENAEWTADSSSGEEDASDSDDVDEDEEDEDSDE